MSLLLAHNNFVYRQGSGSPSLSLLHNLGNSHLCSRQIPSCSYSEVSWCNGILCWPPSQAGTGMACFTQSTAGHSSSQEGGCEQASAGTEANKHWNRPESKLVMTNALSAELSRDRQVPTSSPEGQGGSLWPLGTQVLVRHPGRIKSHELFERWWMQKTLLSSGWLSAERETGKGLGKWSLSSWGPVAPLWCHTVWSKSRLSIVSNAQLLLCLLLSRLCCSASWSLLWAQDRSTAGQKDNIWAEKRGQLFSLGAAFSGIRLGFSWEPSPSVSLTAKFQIRKAASFPHPPPLLNFITTSDALEICVCIFQGHTQRYY